MAFVVVVLVAVLAFFYVRSARRARQEWIRKLNLPGDWRWRDGDAVLRLAGRLDGGRFELNESGQVWRGDWSLTGNEMVLSGGERLERMDLHLFTPGRIGLEDERGVRRVFDRDAGNVVPLRIGDGPG